LTDRFFQPVGDGGRHRRVQRIMPEHLLYTGELLRGRCLRLLLGGCELLLLLLGKFGLTFHTRTSTGFLEQGGESLAGAVEFASHRVGGLLRQRADLFIAQFFVGDQQQQEPIFGSQPIERLLNAFA
jgi:hypothetical protein